MTLTEKELLTSKEAAEYTRLAHQTVYDYTHKKRIPHQKIGKKLLFRVSELDKWLLYGGDEAASIKVTNERE